jgi:hypothetical protein
MSDKYSELELKFHADKVDIGDFNKECMGLNPTSYLHIVSPDVYYKRGQDVCGHRWSGGAGELTVKLRKSCKSTMDRVEVDLGFSPTTALEDVTAFITLTGWKRVFTIVKDAHIYDIEREGFKACLVIYQCWTVEGKDRPKTFIEIEVEKGNAKTPQEDYESLHVWKLWLQKQLKVGKICNKSLYEIYSGERYRLA